MNKDTFLTIFFNRLNQKNIDYFVFGEYANLPNGNGNSDIDIILPNAQFPNLFDVLNNLLQDEKIYVVSYYRNKTSSFVRIMTTDWGVQLDFFGGLYHKGKSYYPLEYLQKNVILYKQFIKVLPIRDSYFVNFLKEIIHIKKAKEKYKKGFIEEYKCNPTRREELLNLFGKQFVDLIDKSIKNDEINKIIPQLSQIIIQKIHKLDLLSRIIIQIFNLKRFLRPPGYVIAVLGTDGSGKSTIIDRITPILNEGFHNGIIYNHLRPNFLPELGILLRKKNKNKTTIVVTNPHAEKQSGITGSIVRWGYYMIDYTFGYLKKVFPVIHSKSKVYIFDRYYYDYYIDQKRSRTQLPNWILKIGEFFIPKPDIILCLGGQPQKIYERKPETSLKEVERQTNALKAFCKKNKRCVWIDTCTDIDTSVKQAMEAICLVMEKRFSKTILR